jgi:hypothetical protein
MRGWGDQRLADAEIKRSGDGRRGVRENKEKGPMLMLSVGPFDEFKKILFTFLW